MLVSSPKALQQHLVSIIVKHVAARFHQVCAIGEKFTPVVLEKTVSPRIRKNNKGKS